MTHFILHRHETIHFLLTRLKQKSIHGLQVVQNLAERQEHISASCIEYVVICYIYDILKII